MTHIRLTKNEEKVLYGLVRNPELNDSELSDQLNVKLSTLTSIKRRLADQHLYQTLTVPLVNRLGCELLAVLYTHFNPVIPLEERVQTTKKTIEVFPEIFFSVGEQEKGFSISLSQNYTTIGRINERRTETFGKLGLLDKEYPNEVIFPFSMSHIARFFDASRLLQKMYNIPEETSSRSPSTWFVDKNQVTLSPKENKVYTAIVEHPTATTQRIGDLVGLSRHTIARMKHRFFSEVLLRYMNLPDLNQLGVELLVFYHLKFNPHKAPSSDEVASLDSPFTIFFANRKFEAVLLAAYPTYQEYKEDEMQKIRFLKEHDLLSSTPLIEPYQFGRMIVIKDADFTPLIKKILIEPS